ncbi:MULTISPECIES: ABC transporter ATP-binding protein [Halococcus]|uniref:Fluoroquinolones export ATP-binding protein n=1 Tax=Halococcus salifodinae DSM 8989 TaxID=1227456 RepID=M0MWH2_9EURY|nr:MULTISPECIES: ABC transporter ATP-binding protein [Halococcus]EMA49179.1 Fluoroquinolones export ATP-binding protein [Halococcus salifodinae DSM 8989]
MIRVRDLQYSYAGANEPALHGLDFDVEDGEVFGFLGPSGAGKTTTQKVLIGLLDDYAGEVRMFDRDVSEWGRELYERIGISAEAPNHYRKLTGRENLELFASLYGGAARSPIELLDRVGMAGAVDRRVGTYSRGMQMRLNFVRALIHEPELVFLDEPTAGIDPGNARAVKTVVEELRKEGTTVFLTTHDMAVADQLCDRVAFIVDGRLPVVDTPRALKLAHGEPTVAVEYRPDGALERRAFPLTSLDDDQAFHDLLRSGHVETIHTEEATLEDVFIAVTGEELT